MKTLKVEWTGFRPLIMANPQTVQVTNPYKLVGRRVNDALKQAVKKIDEERIKMLDTEMRKNDFMASAYWDEEGFFLPDAVVMACLKDAAKKAKKGKDVDRAMIITEERIRVEGIKKFKSLEEAFLSDEFRLEGPCKVPPVRGVLIWKCRCQMPTKWKITFTLEYDPDVVTETQLKDMNTTAGLMIGVGGWRPRFGRFTVRFL